MRTRRRERAAKPTGSGSRAPVLPARPRRERRRAPRRARARPNSRTRRPVRRRDARAADARLHAAERASATTAAPTSPRTNGRSTPAAPRGRSASAARSTKIERSLASSPTPRPATADERLRRARVLLQRQPRASTLTQPATRNHGEPRMVLHVIRNRIVGAIAPSSSFRVRCLAEPRAATLSPLSRCTRRSVPASPGSANIAALPPIPAFACAPLLPVPSAPGVRAGSCLPSSGPRPPPGLHLLATAFRPPLRGSRPPAPTRRAPNPPRPSDPCCDAGGAL